MKLKTRKSKKSYTVMIISDSARNQRKEFHINAGLAGTVMLGSFLLLVGVVCYVVYSVITLSDSLERFRLQADQIVKLQEEIEQLEAEAEGLKAEKEEMAEQINNLNDTVDQHAQVQQALAAEEEEAHIPRGFPLSGTAQLKTEETADDDEDEGMRAHEDRKEVIFAASEGINVIASGTGTVLSVDVDVDYGNVVSIDHGNGYISIYRNNGTPVVKAGNEITRGAILYVVGEDNAELGYSISKDDTYIEPMEMIEING
ncbi:murein hydrolase activator EnvC [Lachnospiraceae bacterium]|jgi:Membrane-bound metallopeptidase|nr:peptidoglycan DD-metalloendopeptidase family protein [Lachnospiraceae bacterium]GFH92741.1 murein hydrolase activator EnvC [Lachnospiraceae bacterium]